MAAAKNTKPFYNTEIPSDWEVKKLSELTIKVGSGVTPTGGETKYKLSGRPFLRSQNIGWGTLLLDDVAFIDEETHKSFQSTEIEEEDVFLNITGASIGRSAIADNNVVGGNVNQHVCILRTKKSTLAPSYLNAFILSSVGQNLIDSFQAGGNRQGLNFEQIKSFKIPLPPLSEQKAIAQVLSTADAAIHSTEKLIAQKELRKKWLMQQLLTGKKRLKGFGGEWKKCTANDFLSQRNEQAPNNGNIPLFSLTIESGITEKSDRYEREFLVKDKSIKNYKIVYPNDIVFNPANLRWGAIAKHTRSFKVLLSPIYEVLSVKKDFDIDFVSYLVSSPRQIAYYASILEGTLIERMAVKVEPFLATKYEIPEKEEQSAIAQVLQAADKETNLLKAKAEKLREQKKGLMQVLLTGKVRLKIDKVKSA